MYKAVIFDLDGTLLNTIDDLADSVRYVQKQFGFAQHDTETVKQHVGNGIRNLIIRSIPQGADNPHFEQAYALFLSYYRQHCEDKTDLYDGISGLLERLKEKKIKMAIVSNKAHEAVQKLYDAYFSGLIDVAFGENESAGIAKKPAPDLVYHALEVLKCTKEEAVYVGDSDVDKATADNAGMDCILCAWGFRPPEMLRSLNPKTIIDQPEELLRYL